MGHTWSWSSFGFWSLLGIHFGNHLRFGLGCKLWLEAEILSHFWIALWTSFATGFGVNPWTNLGATTRAELWTKATFWLLDPFLFILYNPCVVSNTSKCQQKNCHDSNKDPCRAGTVQRCSHVQVLRAFSDAWAYLIIVRNIGVLLN